MIRYSFSSGQLHVTVVARNEEEAVKKLRDGEIESVQIIPDFSKDNFVMDKHYEVATKTRMEAWINVYPGNDDYATINWRDSYGQYSSVTVRNDELTLRGVSTIFKNLGYKVNTLNEKWMHIIK